MKMLLWYIEEVFLKDENQLPQDIVLTSSYAVNSEAVLSALDNIDRKILSAQNNDDDIDTNPLNRTLSFRNKVFYYSLHLEYLVAEIKDEGKTPLGVVGYFLTSDSAEPLIQEGHPFFLFQNDDFLRPNGQWNTSGPMCHGGTDSILIRYFLNRPSKLTIPGLLDLSRIKTKSAVIPNAIERYQGEIIDLTQDRVERPGTVYCEMLDRTDSAYDDVLNQYAKQLISRVNKYRS